jgi:hypothetical protein
MLNNMPGLAQPLGHKAGHRRIVFNEEYAHGPASSFQSSEMGGPAGGLMTNG